LVLSFRYCIGFSPYVGRPIILVIRLTSIETCIPNNRIPPCITASNFLMHLCTSFPLPKCGISSRFIIHVLYRPCIHCLGHNIGTLVALTSFLFKYIYYANSKNLSMSLTSYSTQHSLSTHHRKFGKNCTPFGVHSDL